MTNQPALHNLTEVLRNPEKYRADLEAYLAAKNPAEELLANQRKWLDEKHGPEKRQRPRRT